MTKERYLELKQYFNQRGVKLNAQESWDNFTEIAYLYTDTFNKTLSRTSKWTERAFKDLDPIMLVKEDKPISVEEVLVKEDLYIDNYIDNYIPNYNDTITDLREDLYTDPTAEKDDLFSDIKPKSRGRKKKNI